MGKPIEETSDRLTGRPEALLLALVLVVTFHSIPVWVFSMLPAQQIYDRLGSNGYGILYYAISGVMPLILCLAAPSRSGLKLGIYRGQTLKVIGICALPIVLTGIIYPLTSRPFAGTGTGTWLVSPAAQDLLFAGYLYGLFEAVFPGTVHPRLRLRRAVLLTPIFFALWHTPNFGGMAASYVSFQLLYTMIGGAWMLLARQLTGSVIPGIFTHMSCNFISVL